LAKLFTLFLLLTLSIASAAQDYHFKQYRVKDGLPSDIIKACAQDSLGYFWIATDDGLVKYDGIRFTVYRAPLHSNYVKGFHTSKDGRLLVYGDLDLIQIRNLGDTVIFKALRNVKRVANDSSLSYPKSIYEDSRGSLWVSESQSVVRLRDKDFKRYNFDISNRSPQFLRSFALFEDLQKDLWAVSFQGNAFVYNRAKDEFEQSVEKFPNGIEHISIAEGQLLIGSSDGFYIAPLLSAGGFGKAELKLKAEVVSYTHALPNHKYFIATGGPQNFIGDLANNLFTPVNFSIDNINHIFISGEGDVWLSGNDGLVLMKENLVRRASNVIEFIESVTEDPASGKIYYATKSTLYSFDIHQNRNEALLTIPDGYFQSLVFSEAGIWAANSFQMILYDSEKIKRKFDFGQHGLFITDIIRDSHKNIWLAQPGDNYVSRIDPKLSLRKFKVPIGTEGAINLLREGDDGLYIGSTGKKTYLFFKARGDSVFKNISLPVKFQTYGDFNVSDIAFIDHDVWLATTEGLLKYDRKRIEKTDLGKTHENLPVKSVEVYDKNKLLFANANGLLLYNPKTGALDLFNEGNGLLSNTITPRGLFVDNTLNVWISTSKGLCYTSKPLTLQEKTPRPHVVKILVNGKKIRANANSIISYGSFVSILVSPITFPEKEVVIQYRLAPNETWQAVIGSEINFPEIKAGDYNIEVRAKKNGPYEWSDSTMMHFRVTQPFWKQPWFFLYAFLVAGVLVSITILWVNYRNQKIRHRLELLVEQRTNDLRISNEELSKRNDELDRFVYSASHDLSAPLRSILGLITVAKMEKPSVSMDQYLELMKRSVLKLESFIKDIISFSRNTRLELKKEPVVFEKLIESILADLQFTPEVDKIRFEIIDQLQSELLSDETRLKIIFNNLLSNAIKFHRFGNPSGSFIKVMAKEQLDHFEFTVEDNGTGISAEYKEKIFDMFFRANETVQGSGLGLYILKETVAKLNGKVKVESAVGEGTTFTIQLPK